MSEPIINQCGQAQPAKKTHKKTLLLAFIDPYRPQCPSASPRVPLPARIDLRVPDRIVFGTNGHTECRPAFFDTRCSWISWSKTSRRRTMSSVSGWKQSLGLRLRRRSSSSFCFYSQLAARPCSPNQPSPQCRKSSVLTKHSEGPYCSKPS